ncbi:MAG: SprT-like domain-containing protein [Chitinophagaceae bacterium]
MRKKTEHPLSALNRFLPEGSFDLVVGYLHQYKVHLTVTQARKSILGDYRNAHAGQNHRISVNGNLNPYSFLITLLHELAHLLTFDQYTNRVLPHGNEWKQFYAALLADFVKVNIFPQDIVAELRKSIQNPAASCGGELSLMRTLRKYDPVKEGYLPIEKVPFGNPFIDDKGRVFVKLEKRRTRFVCREIKTGLVYLFSPLYEVRLVADNKQ